MFISLFYLIKKDSWQFLLCNLHIKGLFGRIDNFICKKLVIINRNKTVDLLFWFTVIILWKTDVKSAHFVQKGLKSFLHNEKLKIINKKCWLKLEIFYEIGKKTKKRNLSPALHLEHMSWLMHSIRKNHEKEKKESWKKE